MNDSLCHLSQDFREFAPGSGNTETVSLHLYYTAGCKHFGVLAARHPTKSWLTAEAQST